MQRPPRVVIDTNIFVSGLINPHGQPARVLFAQEHGQIHLLVERPSIWSVGMTISCHSGMHQSWERYKS